MAVSPEMTPETVGLVVLVVEPEPAPKVPLAGLEIVHEYAEGVPPETLTENDPNVREAVVPLSVRPDGVIVTDTALLPSRLFSEIAPDGTPARDRTAVSPREIEAVAERPSSVFTCESEIGPEDGRGITQPV